MMGKLSSSSSTSSFEDLNARLDAALAEQQRQQRKEESHLLDSTNGENSKSKPIGYGTINDTKNATLAEIRSKVVKASIEEQCRQHDTETRNTRVKKPSDIMRERAARDWGDSASRTLAPPEYDESDTDSMTQIQELRRKFEKEGGILPITDAAIDLEGSSIGWDILKSYFSALDNKGDEIVALFIENGIVTANTKDGHGTTPLLVAIKAGNMKMCQELLDFEADIDGLGIPPHGAIHPVSHYCKCVVQELAPRTPLMLAAEMGNLTLVKLFMEVYGANDALVASDGQIALRLAASNGHCEIVRYFPARRGGGWRRWKKEHSKAMSRIRRAGEHIFIFGRVVVWDIPSCLLLRIPKWSVKFFWEKRKKILGWIGEFIKAIPEAVWEVLKWLGRIPKGIPHATVVVAKFLWRMMQTIGRSIAHVGKATFSFLHSVTTAVLTFFRSLTLKDLLNGIMEIFKLPLRLWDLLENLAKSTLKFMKALFGFTGEATTWLFFGVVWVLGYVPRKLWDIIVSIGGLFEKAFKEVAVLVNPRAGF